MRAHGHGDRGQAVALVLVVVAFAALVIVAVGRFGGRIIDRQQAQVAADAAALAGVVGGRDAAQRVAAANSGVLESFVVDDGDVIVVVAVASERATARATRAP